MTGDDQSHPSEGSSNNFSRGGLKKDSRMFGQKGNVIGQLWNTNRWNQR